MKNKKINPYHKTLKISEGDINKIKRECVDEAVLYTMAVFFTVMLDKENASGEDLQRIYKEINSLSESIKKGYVNVLDLVNTLHDEYDITLIKQG